MTDPTAAWPPPRPPDCNAALVLADGTVFWGRGIGATGRAVGEVCFNTSITGYQEILTDPSYAAQIITFTFPHIGNVGANYEDLEATTPAARGLVIRNLPTEPANYRAEQSLDAWLKSHRIVGLCGVDTRRLTRLIRDKGPPNGVIAYQPGRQARSRRDARRGARLARSRRHGSGARGHLPAELRMASDGMAARRRLRHGRRRRGFTSSRSITAPSTTSCACSPSTAAASPSCRPTATPEEIMRHKPDGIFLSNGPGDPAATAEYAVPVLRELIDSGKPMFGICFGHQLLSLALGGTTRKMEKGHRGANHPVQDRLTGKVEITSQNHGFVVDPDSLPDTCRGDAHLAVRRHQRGDAAEKPAGLLGAAPPRGQPRPAGQLLPVPALHRHDGGDAADRK